MRRRKSTSRLVILSGILFTTLVSGCATWQNKTAGMIDQAKDAINLAKVGGADKYAPKLLASADNNLDLARQALQAQNFASAQRFAEKAIVDSEHAQLATDKLAQDEKLASLREQLANLMR
jgi:hypothetical protein